jgi:VRR-NUC domain
VTERELQDWIAATARLLGWRIFHARVARTAKGWRTAVSYDGAGFPDLCLVRDRVVFAEIKVGKNQLSPEQTAWLEALRAAGAEAYVWTDKDWHAGLVEAVFRRERAEAA